MLMRMHVPAQRDILRVSMFVRCIDGVHVIVAMLGVDHIASEGEFPELPHPLKANATMQTTRVGYSCLTTNAIICLPG